MVLASTQEITQPSSAAVTPGSTVPNQGTNKAAIRRATCAQAGAVWLSMLVLGLGFGILVIEAGFPIWVAPVVSAVVYAGSVEFLLIGMMATATPLATIALTTAFTNARHLVYGLTHPIELIGRPHRRLKQCYAIYGLCDETYALTAATPPEQRSETRLMLTTFGNRVGWIGGSTLGAVLGTHWLHGVPGIDFVMTGLFVVLAMDAWQNTPDWRIRGAAVLSTLVAVLVAAGQLIVVALTLFLSIALLHHWVLAREQQQPSR